MSDYPKPSFKNPSKIVLINLCDPLPFYTVKGQTILQLLEGKNPFLNSALINLHIFCYDDYTYQYLLESGFNFSDAAKNKQAEKRRQYSQDTLAYNDTYAGLPETEFSNVKLYKPDYKIGFGTHAGKRVDQVIRQSPACIENIIHSIFWFGLTKAGIQLMKEMEPGYIFLASTWDLLKRKYQAAPDFMKGIRRSQDAYYNDNEDLEYESEYRGSWASEQEGFSDDDIDSAFDGDPDAYWNID